MSYDLNTKNTIAVSAAITLGVLGIVAGVVTGSIISGEQQTAQKVACVSHGGSIIPNPQTDDFKCVVGNPNNG
jgi:hypothetical protein